VKRTAVLVLLPLLLAAAACGGGSDDEGSDGRDRVTVVLDWTPNTNHAGVYLAEAQGRYREAGLDVRIIEPGDAGALQLLASGKADVAFSPQEELIPARSGQGVPVVALAAVIQHNTSSLLSLASDGIEGPGDLPGHTYGGYGGPLETALVSALAECGGGDPDEVRFAEVGDVDYRVGLERGQYDVVWIYDAWDKIRLRQAGVDVATIPFLDHTDCIPDWYTPMLATTESELDGDRRAVLERFMDVTRTGYQEAMADPGGAADALLDAVPELDEQLVRASAEYLSTRYAEDPEEWGVQDRAVWERFAAFLGEAGMVEGEVDVDAAFTNDLL
jgi:ABC-type nitrate/sulfonate/bicarbonate transport system substrate-binding protein